MRSRLTQAIASLRRQQCSVQKYPFRWAVFFHEEGSPGVVVFDTDEELVAFADEQRQRSSAVITLPRRIP